MVNRKGTPKRVIKGTPASDETPTGTGGTNETSRNDDFDSQGIMGDFPSGESLSELDLLAISAGEQQLAFATMWYIDNVTQKYIEEAAKEMIFNATREDLNVLSDGGNRNQDQFFKFKSGDAVRNEAVAALQEGKHSTGSSVDALNPEPIVQQNLTLSNRPQQHEMLDERPSSSSAVLTVTEEEIVKLHPDMNYTPSAPTSPHSNVDDGDINDLDNGPRLGSNADSLNSQVEVIQSVKSDGACISLRNQQREGDAHLEGNDNLPRMVLASQLSEVSEIGPTPTPPPSVVSQEKLCRSTDNAALFDVVPETQQQVVSSISAKLSASVSPLNKLSQSVESEAAFCKAPTHMKEAFPTRAPSAVGKKRVDLDYQPPRNFECDFGNCNLSFVTKHALQNHQRNVHSGSKNCAGCGQGLKNKECVRQHRPTCSNDTMRTKLEVPCYANVAGCTQAYWLWTDMEQHLKTHHPDFDMKDFENFPLPYVERPRNPKAPPRLKSLAKRKQSSASDKSCEQSFPSQLCRDTKGSGPRISAASVKPIPVTRRIERSHSTTIHTTPDVEDHDEVTQVRSIAVLSPTDIIKIFKPTDNNDYYYPGHARIELSEDGILNHFPAFMTFFKKSKLLLKGGVVIRPPPHFEPYKDRAGLHKKMGDIKIQSMDVTVVNVIHESGKAYELTTTAESKGKKSNYSILTHRDNSDDGEYATISPALIEKRFFKELDEKKACAPYVQNLDNSLFDDNTGFWNLSRLQNDLTDPAIFGEKDKKGLYVAPKLCGLNRPQLYIGRRNTVIPLHKEDMNLGSVLYHHEGAHKILYVVGPEFAKDLENNFRLLFPEAAKTCPSFLRHKMYFLKPVLLEDWKIPFTKIIMKEGDYVVLSPNSYHFGLNIGFNVVESVNFLSCEVMEYFLDNGYECFCRNIPITLPKAGVIKKYIPQSLDSYIAGSMKAHRPHTADEIYEVPNMRQFLEAYVREHNRRVASSSDRMAWFDDKGPQSISLDILLKIQSPKEMSTFPKPVFKRKASQLLEDEEEQVISSQDKSLDSAEKRHYSPPECEKGLSESQEDMIKSKEAEGSQSRGKVGSQARIGMRRVNSPIRKGSNKQKPNVRNLRSLSQNT